MRSPRRREQEDDDEDDERRNERRERERDRRRRPDDSRPAVGEDFRLRACEQSLREHQTELASQRVATQQLNEAMVQNNQHKQMTGDRLDAVLE